MKLEQSQMTLQEQDYIQIGRFEYLKTNTLFIITMILTPVSIISYFLHYINDDFMFIISTLILLVLSIGIGGNNGELKDEMIDGIVSNKKSENFFMNLGFFVKEHSRKGAGDDFNRENIVNPITVDEALYRTHMNIIGTTGSGKTVMVKSIMRQLIRDIGGGFLFIDGKGDSGMLHEIYSEAVLAHREHDYFILNFLDKNNSNTLNPLELGDIDSITNLLSDFIFSSESNSDTWESGGKELFQVILKPIIILRDANLMWNPDYTREINSIEDIEKHQDTLSISLLKDLISSPANVFEFAIAISRIYKTDRTEFEKRLNTNNINKSKGEIFDNESKRVEIHDGLKTILISQGQEIPEWEKVVEIGSFTALMDSVKDQSKAIYKIGISTGYYGKLFTTFIEQFGEIFAAKEGDINLEDIIVNGKILHVVLQGINPSVASSIGKFMLSLIRMIAKKRGKKKALINPYNIILDEFNSWSAGINGFADLMSVTRSYGLSFILMYQSDLMKIDDGKGIEKGQIMANTNITILLKLNDDNITKNIIESLPKKKVLKRQLKVRGESDDKQQPIENSYEEKEDNFLEAKDMRNLKSGQGYMYVNGQIYKMISTYIPDNTRFDIDAEKDIPINKLVKKNIEVIKIKY